MSDQPPVPQDQPPAAPSYPPPPPGYPQQPPGYPQAPPGYPQQPPGYPQQPAAPPPQPGYAPPPPVAGQEPSEQAPGRDRGGLVAGIIVAGIGVFLLAGQLVPDVGRWIPLFVGLAFMAAFLVKREYGLLVAGSIITGVGVGIVLQEAVDGSAGGAVMLLALAAGFGGIWALGTLLSLPQNHWWPLIPGGIVALVGMLRLAEAEVDGVLRLWPLVLVLIGVLTIGRALLRNRS